MGARYELRGLRADKWIELFASDYWPAPERIPFETSGFQLDRVDCENERFVRTLDPRGPHVFRVKARTEGSEMFLLFRVELVTEPDGMSLFSPLACLKSGSEEVDGGFVWVGCDRYPIPNPGMVRHLDERDDAR